MKGPKYFNAKGRHVIPNSSAERYKILPRVENCDTEEYLDIILKSNPPKHVMGTVNRNVTLVAATRSAVSLYEWMALKIILLRYGPDKVITPAIVI